MRRRMIFKLALCYLIAFIGMFVLINTYGVWKLDRRLIEQKRQILYDEATLIISEYVDQYYQSDMGIRDRNAMTRQLRTIDTFLNARIWVLDGNGVVIVDTRSNAVDLDINSLDDNFLEQTFIEDAYFKGIFTEPMLCVIQSLSYNYTIRGYVCISTSMKGITAQSIFYLDAFNLCYLWFQIVLIGIFFIIYRITVRPVLKMTETTKAYASGNFENPMRIRSQDEYGELAGVITYMAEELKNLDDYQKKFVANISHDFRSPLTSIRGYAEAMKDGTIPYEMQGKYLDIILFETERLTKLTKNLLELNSFDQNGRLLDIRSFDINAVIKTTAAAFEGICTKKKIVLQLEFENREQYVDADMDKIQQVLYNLIDNAIKFSNTDSSIRVATQVRGLKVFIGVKDYGIGIPKDSLKKIWDRFYKTDLSRGKDKKGTGLGLSIVKEIITAHNENITVVSTEGVGTEFIFTLPKSE